MRFPHGHHVTEEDLFDKDFPAEGDPLGECAAVLDLGTRMFGSVQWTDSMCKEVALAWNTRILSVSAIFISMAPLWMCKALL